jgi:hypothetical protein
MLYQIIIGYILFGLISIYLRTNAGYGKNDVFEEQSAVGAQS